MCVCPLLQVCVCVPTAPSVCAEKCREKNFTAGYTLYNYVCIKKKKIYIYIYIYSKPIFFFTKPITDYGKMLKYREKYR